MSRESSRYFRARHLAMVMGAAVVAFTIGCKSTPKAELKPPTVKTLRLTHHVGGTHYRTVVHNGFWYQTFDQSLLVMEPNSVVAVNTIELGPSGETGPAIDMAIDAEGKMYIVIEHDEIVRLSLHMPRSPVIVQRIPAAELGILPRRLSMVDGEMYVSGHGGVVRLRDRKAVLTSDSDVSRVAKSDSGLIACIGRRAIRLDDGRYVGSASDVQMLHHPGAPEGTIVFERQGEKGVLVGLMSPEVRELDAERATVAVPGIWRSSRVIGDRLWVVTDDLISGFTIKDGTLSSPIHVNVVGARDVAEVMPSQLAVAGSFGRSLYRVEADSAGPAETFWQVIREPSRLTQAVSDGRHVLAGSREGLWMYLINARAEVTTKPFEGVPPQPSTSAVVAGAQAMISDDRTSITITSTSQEEIDAPPFTYVEAAGCELHCVVAVDGEFWIGHDRGITVLLHAALLVEEDSKKKVQDASAARDLRVVGRLRLAGPVRYIHPLLVGGGASFVSEFGGFGVATIKDEPISASAAAK